MSEPYLLTVYIAEKGTPYRHPYKGTITESGGGHMWYGIRQGDGDEQTYGFAPKKEGSPLGPGKVVTNDNDTYYRPRYTRTIELTKEQYEKFIEFGQDGLREKWSLGFDSQYNLANNSCVDFTWNALKHAGLELNGKEINTEGKVWPGNNWGLVQKLTNPAVENEYSRTDYGLPAKEGMAELTANKSARPRKNTDTEASPPPSRMHRLLCAHTPLGDGLWAVSVRGREALSSLYRLTVRFKSDSPDVDGQALIGELCALELETDRQGKRWLSGQMIDFAAVGEEGRHWVYEATVVPKLWHASRRADFRIWQNQTVPDILDQVLGENAVRFERRLKATYKTWTYLVQYRESDLAFILRQLEHEGIFFWFEHAADGETLVLADHLTSHPECSGEASVPYYSGTQSRPDSDHFDGWRLTRRVESGRFIHSDYDFERPSSDLTTEHADPRGHWFDHYERFHYPGDYIETRDGSQYASNSLERLQREQETVHLSGRVRNAAPGHRLTLSAHPRADQNRELTLTAVSYEIIDNDYEATDGSSVTRFHVEVEAIPAHRPFRPPLTTPKPRTRGVETAVVVGPPGEEIHTDEYGRVKVHFHWDRYGQRDGNDTCWIRVASPWAGSNFGAIHIPRIGQEVIVDFEHGDPDRPMITGRVYNAEQMPPWALPANQTQSGILTRSSKGGASGAGMRDGVGDANALRFEDKKGQEQVWFHAQKDYLTEVEHDESKWVGQDRRKEIGRDEFSTIHRDRTEEVDRNETITIHGWRKEEVDLDETITIHKNRKKTVDLNEKMHIGINRTESVGRNERVKIGVNQNLRVGANKQETIGLTSLKSVGIAQMTNIGAAYNLNVGAAWMTNVGFINIENIGKVKKVNVGESTSFSSGKTTSITAGEDITILAGKNIVLQSGGTKIVLDGENNTISIEADQVLIDGTTLVDINSQKIDLN